MRGVALADLLPREPQPVAGGARPEVLDQQTSAVSSSPRGSPAPRAALQVQR